MQIKPWQVTVTIVCLISGLLFAYNLQMHPNTLGPATQKNKPMAAKVQEYESENINYETEIATLRQQIDKIQKQQTAGQTDLAGLQDQLDKAKMKAGLFDVQGPGIILTLDDRKDALELVKQSGQAFDIWDYIVHDSYLLNLVADLRAAGAEAISLNEERIVTTTDIKCGGTIVFANSTRLGAPFTIKAIGNPEKLVAALDHSFTYNSLEYSNYPLNVKKETKIFIPAYHGSYTPNYAKIVKE